jgi:hypothetical protein
MGTALERVLSVLAGCVLGLLITFAFHSRFVSRPAEEPINKDKEKGGE